MYKSLLEDAGIACFIRNLHTQQSLFGLAMAVLPLPDFIPALCVVNDEDYAEAMAILESPCDSGADWKCSACGEAVPAELTACWSCQSPRNEPAPK
jgi:hypothetical protein